MKIGLRTPSPTRTVKAKTTGRANRIAKSAIDPTYGKKGVGYIKNPKRAIYNRFYHKLTVDPLDPVKKSKVSFRTPVVLILLFYLVTIVFEQMVIYDYVMHKTFNIMNFSVFAVCLIITLILGNMRDQHED